MRLAQVDPISEISHLPVNRKRLASVFSELTDVALSKLLFTRASFDFTHKQNRTRAKAAMPWGATRLAVELFFAEERARGIGVGGCRVSECVRKEKLRPKPDAVFA